MIWMTLVGAMSGIPATNPQRRILLVEDDFLVGLSIKTILERIGCEVLGPIPSVTKALDALQQEEIDAAVLDINIIGGTSVPVAERLQEQHRPFVFVTGYQSPNHLLPQMLREVTRLNKPVDERSLSAALHAAMQ